MTRVVSAAGFAIACLAFTLPFGMVSSCSGGEVQFTGIELATFSVEADRPIDRELGDEVEGNAGLIAVIAFVSAAVGFTLAVLGVKGTGVCATIALVAMQLLLYVIVGSSDAGGEPFSGFWLALGSVALAALACVVGELRARRRLQKPSLPVIGLAVAVVLPPVGLVVAAFGAMFVLMVRRIRGRASIRPETG